MYLWKTPRVWKSILRASRISFFSHGHNDHTGGLPAFAAKFSQKIRLYAHPNAFTPKRNRGMDVGSPLALGDLPPQIEPHLIGQPKQIGEHAMYLGEIPRIYAFEADRVVGEAQSACSCCWEPDKVSDDTALALALPDGVFVVTGCAHAGVCNTVRYAKAMTEKERVLGVLGGFHLFQTGEVLDQTIETLRSLGVERVYPAHCTSLAVKSAFFCAFDTVEVGVGLTLEW